MRPKAGWLGCDVLLLVAAAAVVVGVRELGVVAELELLYEVVDVVGDVEAAGATVAWLTKWCAVERFRRVATRLWCLTGDLTCRVSCRSSLAIALASASKGLVAPSVNPVVAARLLDRAGVGGRLALPLS